MARGAHLTNPDTVAKRLEARKATREKYRQFFIHVGDYRITRDGYNLILIQKMTAEDSGNIYPSVLGFYNTLEGIITALKDKGVAEKDLELFRARTKDIKISWKDGNMIFKLPKTFTADPDDIQDTEEVPE